MDNWKIIARAFNRLAREREEASFKLQGEKRDTAKREEQLFRDIENAIIDVASEQK